MSYLAETPKHFERRTFGPGPKCPGPNCPGPKCPGLNVPGPNCLTPVLGEGYFTAILKLFNLRLRFCFLQETEYMLLTYLAIFNVQNSCRPHEICTCQQYLVAIGGQYIAKIQRWASCGGGSVWVRYN